LRKKFAFIDFIERISKKKILFFLFQFYSAVVTDVLSVLFLQVFRVYVAAVAVSRERNLFSFFSAGSAFDA
jgi:hypothetical protein